jgi:tetratricopeptide repeat protein 21B
MLALAITKYLQKKDVEGNNFLKLCAKLTYQPDYGEELERAWLLHAETYVQIKKFDNA